MAKKRYHSSGVADQMAKDSSKNFGQYMGGSWLSFQDNEMAGMPRGVKMMDVPGEHYGLNVAVPGNITSMDKQMREDNSVLRRINTHPRKI